MVVDFSKIDLQERPVLILKNITGTPIGVLGAAMNISADLKYNEASVLNFTLPAQTDGEPTPNYDSVIGMRIVDLQDIGQFMLMNPEESGDGVKKVKTCKGYSLEYEFTFKKITLENATYNFWNPVAPDDTVLGIILDMMPSWHVGSVDSSLVGKYRTFDVSDENLYNFIKGTLQNSYNCIFDFDTYKREVNVRDVSSAVPVNPIYISIANLAKEITVKENTENIVTRLDVNGADGVDIRDVNPSGTNQLINLDYFMTTDNFSQPLIDKYYSWKEQYQKYQQQYYNLSIEYSLQIMRKATEEAALTELQNDLTSLENQQAVIIQGIAMSVKSQSALDEINKKLAAKHAEIKSQNAVIKNVASQASAIYEELIKINAETRFQSYFTEEEYLILDRYMKDDAVSESSFVAQETATYTDDDIGNPISNMTIAVSGAKVSLVTNAQSKDIYDIKNGKLTVGNITANIISAAFEKAKDNGFAMTAYLDSGTAGDKSFPNACLSLTGSVSSVTNDLTADQDISGIKNGTALSVLVKSGYLYFTFNTSEYEKRAVAWDLYEYGNEILQRISQPSYTFGVTSANFLCLEDFTAFKNKLRHGEKLYVSIDEEQTLSPICIGVKINYDAINELSLEFCDTYISGDSSFLLADLLEQSVSMGKNVDLSKFTYSAFIDSGASTKVKDFMTTALDVSKNAIMSSKDQAISWGDSGIRLRKWADEAHEEYDPKQVWMNNNSILMTSNNWATAELAIGNFHDENLGDCWGIVAPNIVGTLLAGNNLVIESAKKDGGIAVFRVDGDGCVLYNSSMDIVSENNVTQIALDPQFGIVIGKYPVYKTSQARSAKVTKTVDTDKARFWVDTEGNLFFQGTLRATTGEFSGKVTALEGYIGQPGAGWVIGSTHIYNGKPSFSSTTEGVYIGVDGFSLGDGNKYIRGNRNGTFSANNVTVSGQITATSGTIGGCTIRDGMLEIDGANIKSGTINSARIPNLSADKITSGTLDASVVTVKNLNAENITTGTLNVNRIPNLSAGKITSGTLDASKVTVTNLDASNINTGTLTVGGISWSGQFPTAQIPNLSADKITTGTLDGDNVTVKNLDASNIKSGTLSAKYISGGTLSGCSINIGNGTFYVNSYGYASLKIDTFAVYDSGGGYHSGQTFTMHVVRNVTAAVVVSKIVLSFVQGVCVGWYDGND